MQKKWLMVFAVALILAAFISPFAASSPDGLEKVAEDKGFLYKGTSFVISPIPDYLVPGIANEGVATAVAGVTGTILTFGVMYGFSRIVLVKKKEPGNTANDG